MYNHISAHCFITSLPPQHRDPQIFSQKIELSSYHPTFTGHITMSHPLAKKQFLQYISPLLSPPHALPAGIPHAYRSAILLSQRKGSGIFVFTLAINIAAIQNSAAEIVLCLIPTISSIPIELLHRTVCVALLRHTEPDAFETPSTSCIVSRSLLSRF